jgi:DNA-binding NarL/FixJ family response regulator
VALWLAGLHQALGQHDLAADYLGLAAPVIETLGDARSRRRLHALESRMSLDSPEVAAHDLTPRQLEVLRAMSKGATNGEIARELGVSLSTVRHCSSSAMR